MYAKTLSVWLAAAALAAPLTAAAQQTPNLRSLFEQAWQRAPEGRSASARSEEMAATREQAQSWLATAPVLELAQRSDRWNAGLGQKENEASISASIYLPGQRTARLALAERSSQAMQDQLAKARLELAGELRTRFWDVAAANTVLDERESHLKHTGELSDEVARRVAAGELARSDLLLAQHELAGIRILAEQARGQARAALLRLQQLSGPATLPPLQPEALAAATPAEDPRLAAAAASARRAEAALQFAQASRLPTPSLALTLRQEKDARLLPPVSSVGLALQIPLGSAGRNRIAEAQALAQKEAATAEHDLLAAASEQARLLAQENLARAASAVQAARERAAAAAEYSQLITKAFRLGERGLADMIRAHTLAHEASIALRQQEVALGRAHAEFNQAVGVLP